LSREPAEKSEKKDQRPVCFVVMGFGKKTDYETGLTFDLDQTYESIIRPAAEDLGLRPIRADEFTRSAVIDVEMYEMLLRADVVVADISTGNVNAVYELGVRHALRPNTTVIMKENQGRLHFDLNHVNTFQYKHLGEDIGVKEAARARKALSELIEGALASRTPDSPVYTYLPRLQKPQMSDADYADLLDEAEEGQERLSSFLRAGEAAFRESKMEDAVAAYTSAAAMKPDEPFIVQQLALATYKSKNPSDLEALMTAMQIMAKLDPDNSNDPETLGLSGAIRKRLWIRTEDTVQLDLAIKYYSRGFEVRRDYYNGENAALCYDIRAEIQPDAAEQQFDRMCAYKIRLALVDILNGIISDESFPERSDGVWVYATLANCMFALDREAEAEVYEKSFFSTNPAQWVIDTYQDSKKLALSVVRHHR